MKMQYSPIGKLYRLLTTQPAPVLLLGAGASVKSGVPLAGQMVERAARWAYANAHGRSPDDPRLLRSDWMPWLEDQAWYKKDAPPYDNYPAAVENLLQPRQARADFFRQLLMTGIAPSPGYETLAEFMAQGLVPVVLTTNFDTLLPEVRVLKRRPHYIDVIQTPSDYVKFSTTPQYPLLVYAHGSVDHYTDKNRENEVQRLDDDLVVKLIPLLRDRPLIVVGYRGAEASVMKHLLLDNTDQANAYRHGIFWCKLKNEREDDLSPMVKELATRISGNFSLVDIDGFDELFSRDLWQLHLDAGAASGTVSAPATALAPTFDMAPTGSTQLDGLDWPTLRPRLQKYCSELQIKVPADPDDNWYADQLFQANLALRLEDRSVRATRAGCLLFGLAPQTEVPGAKVLIRAAGNVDWIGAALGQKAGEVEDAKLERVIEGNLWAQYDTVMGLLGSFNRPFRLKGATSETVTPYPPLAIKEVVVNALVHRDYGAEGMIVVDLEPGSIRITNPGGLVEEVQRRVGDSIESEIRKGRRGIKGYRNPVIADLFYGSGEMDKRGSGLSDVYRTVRDAGGDVTFGPAEDNSAFSVQLFSRPEAVDQTTGTALPTVLTSTTYAGNALEVVELPKTLFHGHTEIEWVGEIWRRLPNQFIPPFLLHEHKIFTFHDLDDEANPLRSLVDPGTIEPIATSEFFQGADGERLLVRILNDSLRKHLYSRGLIVDNKRKRAYFSRTPQGVRTISYQGRLRRARRTVVKARTSPATGKITYWEHEALGYQFLKFGNTWALMLEPGYVFTFDGKKGLLAPEKINKLSTKRASRDYNSAVLNDLSFWTWLIAGGTSPIFSFNVCGEHLPIVADLEEEPAAEPDRRPAEHEDERWDVVAIDRAQRASQFTSFQTEPGTLFERPPVIALMANLPTITINDMNLAPEDGSDLLEESDDLEELEEELEQLAEEGRQESEAAARDGDTGDGA
ncbi:MAG: ATP-binding protein [Rhizomicrobium sp.]